MSIMMVQVDVMCCKSVGTDLSMLDIDDLMTEICQLKKEVKLLETKLRERDELNREDVCGVSLCDVTDQTSPDLLLSVCNEEQNTSVKLLDCEMKLKTEIKEEQTDEDDVIYSDLMKVKEESSEPNEVDEKPYHLIIGEESLSCLNTEQNVSPKNSRTATDKEFRTCPQCGKTINKFKLKRHMRIHTGERPYRCDHCEKCFISNCHLKRHMKIHTGERAYKCDQCEKTFMRKDNLNEHVRLHNGEKPYGCDLCGMMFFYKYMLQVHMIHHAEEKSYHCTSLEQSFKDSRRLETHRKKFKNQIKEQTEEDDVIHSDLMEVKEESSELNEMEEKPHHLIIGEESLSCLNTEQNVSQKNKATDKESPSCPQCGKVFTHKSKLNRHMRIHTGERPYRCDHCGMTFISNCHLKRHMKIHTGERAYKCDQCEKTFIRKDHLNDHMRLHNGEKSFHCSSRGRSFKDSKRLETHRNKCCKVHPHESGQTRRSLRSSAVTC